MRGWWAGRAGEGVGAGLLRDGEEQPPALCLPRSCRLWQSSFPFLRSKSWRNGMVRVRAGFCREGASHPLIHALEEVGIWPSQAAWHSLHCGAPREAEGRRGGGRDANRRRRGQSEGCGDAEAQRQRRPRDGDPGGRRPRSRERPGRGPHDEAGKARKSPARGQGAGGALERPARCSWQPVPVHTNTRFAGQTNLGGV